MTPINSPKKLHRNPSAYKPLQLRLQALLDLYDLSVGEAAKRADWSADTLYSWLSTPGSPRYRAISWKQFDRFQKTLHEAIGEITPDS